MTLSVARGKSSQGKLILCFQCRAELSGKIRKFLYCRGCDRAVKTAPKAIYKGSGFTGAAKKS